MSEELLASERVAIGVGAQRVPERTSYFSFDHFSLAATYTDTRYFNMTIEWPVIALGVDLSEQPSPAERAGRFILLSFSNKDCARFYDCLGDHFNIQFLSDCVRYIVGAPGDLVGPDGEHQDTRETVEALTASNKSLVYFYNLANPTKSVSKTFIPSTELSEPTSSGSQSPSSASSSTDTSEAPSMLSGRTLNDLGLDLGPFSDMEFSRGSKRARHRQLKKATDARDGSCRLTGSPISWCEAAHLFKESNPDQVSPFCPFILFVLTNKYQSLIAMLYSRRALYPGLESSVRTFREGVCASDSTAVQVICPCQDSAMIPRSP